MGKDKGSSFQRGKSTCSLDPIALFSSTIVTCAKSTKPHIEEEAEPAIDDVNAPRLRPEIPDKGSCNKKTKCEDEPSRQDSSNKTVEPRHDLEAGLENKPHHDAVVHFGRGWAWVVCTTTFVMEFFVDGLITSSGLIYAALESLRSQEPKQVKLHFNLLASPIAQMLDSVIHRRGYYHYSAD